VPRLLARLVVDYFAYAVHLALPRLLAWLAWVPWLLVWLIVDNFAYAVRVGIYLVQKEY
jgi:hypothetical protein